MSITAASRFETVRTAMQKAMNGYVPTTNRPVSAW
jgi:hypothetical protein